MMETKTIAIFVSVAIALIAIYIFYLLFNNSNNFKSYEKKEGVIEDKNGNKKVKITLYVASDFIQKARGLMFVDELSYKEGMLFLMSKEEKHSFWMKNVRINLDAIGLNKEGKIIDIVKMKKERNGEYSSYRIRGFYVIEVRGGFIEKYKIKKGDVVKIENYTT